jgi:hypothetical protein
MTHKAETFPGPLDAIDVDPHSGEVDLTLIRDNLLLTPAERLEQHDRARDFALMVWRAGLKRRSIDPESAPTPELNTASNSSSSAESPLSPTVQRVTSPTVHQIHAQR